MPKHTHNSTKQKCPSPSIRGGGKLYKPKIKHHEENFIISFADNINRFNKLRKIR